MKKDEVVLVQLRIVAPRAAWLLPEFEDLMKVAEPKVEALPGMPFSVQVGMLRHALDVYEEVLAEYNQRN